MVNNRKKKQHLRVEALAILLLLFPIVSGNETTKANVQCENGHPIIENTFSWADYLVLGTMLVVSCGIGLFYGFIGSKQLTSEDFLLGGSTMGTFPMAMSLAARY